jgi:hypothetical protein
VGYVHKHIYVLDKIKDKFPGVEFTEVYSEERDCRALLVNGHWAINSPLCLDWCKKARECVGEEMYNTYMNNREKVKS